MTIQNRTNLIVVQIGEMESIYSGINFGRALNQKIMYSLDNENQRVYDDKILRNPFLTVNIGSGVSIIKFSEPIGEFQRVGGTSLGGSPGITRRHFPGSMQQAGRHRRL